MRRALATFDRRDAVTHDRDVDLPMDLPGPFARLVDEAGASPGWAVS
jgi:hypothetical protein